MAATFIRSCGLFSEKRVGAELPSWERYWADNKKWRVFIGDWMPNVLLFVFSIVALAATPGAPESTLWRLDVGFNLIAATYAFAAYEVTRHQLKGFRRKCIKRLHRDKPSPR